MVSDRLARVPRKLASFRRGANAAIRFFRSKDEDEKREALFTALGELLRSLLDQTRARGIEDAKGAAVEVLHRWPQLRERLDAVPHLGALASIAPGPATRFDYTCLKFTTLLKLRKLDPIGLGLAPTYDFVFLDKERTGLEIAQLWALLLNGGHLFGTFSTERAVLFEMARNPALQRELISQIDSSVSPFCERVIRSRSIYRFFYVLAAWQVSRSRVPIEIRRGCLTALRLYLDCPKELARVRVAYGLARQIAYLQLHNFLLFGQVPRAIENSWPFKDILNTSNLTPAPGTVEESVTGLLEAMDRFQFRTTFTSPASAESVLSHLREFKLWWARQNDVDMPLVNRIESLFVRPPDWPEIPRKGWDWSLRLEIPGGEAHWVEEARTWWSDGKPWISANFLLSYAPRESSLLVDVFGRSNIHAAVAEHVTDRLSKAMASFWYLEPRTRTRLSQSAANFAAVLLSAILHKGRVHIEPTACGEGFVSAIASRDHGELASRLATCTDQMDDSGRADELRALAHLVSSNGATMPGPWIAIVGRLLLLDETTGTTIAEIDGACASCHASGVRWYFVEQKARRLSGASQQLATLRAMIHAPSSEPVDGDSGGNGRIRWFTVDSPLNLEDTVSR